MMGVGKSSIGKDLSHKLKMEFTDIDSIIEKKLSLSISEIFKKKGEKFFRDIEEKLLINAQQFDDLFKQIFVEYVGDECTVEERINLAVLDSLLKLELGNKSIDTDYDYAVLVENSDILMPQESKKNKTAIFKSDHKVNLFPNEIFSKPEQLFVHFPDRQQYVLSSIWGMLSGSVIFTLVIILVFTYTIYIILRQKKLSEIKTDFINNMTHEFKTPIATISLASDSILNPAILSDGKRVTQYTNIIREENKRMHSQVEKVLQMALLDKQNYNLKKEFVDVHELINKAVDHVSLGVQQKGGKITADLTALESEVRADETHLSNVIHNLLDNANKYSPENPDIKVTTESSESGIFISITDNGIGMSKDTLKRIFEKFYRVPTGNVHNVKGFGLGLSYVKAMIDAHGGTIDVSSRLKRGSTFKIFLPFYS